MGGYDQIAFVDFAQLPSAHYVGDAPILLNAADDHLGDEFSVAIDQHFSVRHNLLIFADIDYDKMPLRIRDQHFAFYVSWQFNWGVGATIKRNVSIEFLNSFAQERIFLL